MLWSRRRKLLFLALLLAINGGALFTAGNLPLGGNKKVQVPMLERTEADMAVVYFGFPKCSTVCPVTMQRLAEAYPALRKEVGKLGIFFVNLEPSAKPSHTRAYAHSFHPQFLAVAPSDQARARLSRTFGAWLYQTGPKHEPYHNPYLYLLARSGGQWQIRQRIPADGEGVAKLRQALDDLDDSV
jgi:cytochrome oxidase Cu insertion factor (SCO1/SenC/PrrC family)